jgi:hypothetical protein
MKGLRQAGSVGALLFALSFILLFLSLAVIQPSLGVIGPADGINPAKILPQASAFRLLFAIPILFGAGVCLTALALNDRLQAQAPSRMRIATAAAVIGSALFVAAGSLGFVALPELASVYAQNASGVTTAEMALIDGIATALLTAGVLAAGWWVLLASLAALAGGLPKILAYVGLLFGLVAILAFVISPLTIVGAILGIVWAVWVGIVLMREPPAMRAMGSARS